MKPVDPVLGGATPGHHRGSPYGRLASGDYCLGVKSSAPRVLVVDDSETIRALIALNLELEGFDVHQATDGQECLDVVATVRPHVITMDVAMPRLDGFGAAARLRSA